MLLFKHQGNMSEWKWGESKKRALWLSHRYTLNLVPCLSVCRCLLCIMDMVWDTVYARFLDMRASRTDSCCLWAIRQGCHSRPRGLHWISLCLSSGDQTKIMKNQVLIKKMNWFVNNILWHLYFKGAFTNAAFSPYEQKPGVFSPWSVQQPIQHRARSSWCTPKSTLAHFDCSDKVKPLWINPTVGSEPNMPCVLRCGRYFSVNASC